MAENFSDKISDTVKEPQTNEFYNFGAFRIDVKKHRLWRGEELIALTPKEFELLLMLVEHAGRIVEKDDLHAQIWKDTFVEDGTLTRNISWLRKKLGAGNKSGEQFIETCPKRGYRFLPEVTKSSGGNALVIEEQTRTHIRIEEITSIADVGFGIANSELIRLPTTNPQSQIRNPKLLFLLGVLAIAVIGFAGYQIYLQRSAPKVVFAPRVVPFSGLPGMEMMPAFSPDSKQIVFCWNGGNGENVGDEELFDVYVKIIGTGEPVRLTNGKTNAYFPIFSPDGKNIAFFRSTPETSKIFLISALGGAERKICDVQSGATSFSFSPNGKTIATADRDPQTSANGIFSVDVATGVKTRLTTPPENFTDHTPRFSPDGKQIAFVRAGIRDDQDLFVISATDSTVQQPRRLTFDQSGLSGLAWSADGAALIFTSKRGGSLSFNLWEIAAEGGEPKPVITGGKNPINPAVAPDGKTVAFVERFQDTNIWQLKSEPPALAGRSIAQENLPANASSSDKIIASARPDHSQHISPDGKKIVFASERAGESGLWISVGRL